MQEKYTSVIWYGLQQFAGACGSALSYTLPEDASEVNWGAYEAEIGERQKAGKLQAILSAVHLNNDQPLPPQTFYLPRLLSLDKIFPDQLAQEKETETLLDLKNAFETHLNVISRYHDNPALFFQAFYHTFRKLGWAIPGEYGGVGISLFEQWKAVTSLLFASGSDWKDHPANEYTLVGGDIPGIQDFVYTITSKGAAKALRGRSFFVQLLGEAVIQRLLDELQLSTANVIYAAGGNFMLLAPGLNTRVDGKIVAGVLEDLRVEFDKTLLAEFHGDLSLSLAWTPIHVGDIGSHTFASEASKSLKELIAERKRMRFGGAAVKEWDQLFAPQGKTGNRYCAICQVPLAKGEGMELPGQEGLAKEERVRACEACESFGELARALGKAKFISIGSQKPQKTEKWQDVLFKVSINWFSLEKTGETIYTLNNTDFVEKDAYGFRFVANVTPHVTQEDIDDWKDEEDDERKPELGDVRTFSQIARSAKGVNSIGVLRMDVDNLGQVMVRGLEPRTMAGTSALSFALDLFFSGYLNKICEELQTKQDRAESLYIIYAGGDDLFVIGAWDLMPELAEKIKSEFARYTGNNQSLTISGAVTLEGKKFPLYQAAEHAGEAESRAKSYKRNHQEKHAIHFLGMDIGWEEWQKVTSYRDDIQIALDGGAPRALLQILQDIHTQYEEQLRNRKVVFGPWMWRGAYAMSRLAGRIKESSAREAVNRLTRTSLRPEKIRFAGLAARWTELLRK